MRNLGKLTAAILLTAAVAAAAVIILAPRLLQLDSCRAQILSMAQNALHRPVSYESASFSRHLAPAIVFQGITIGEKSEDAAFLKIDRLTFKLSILPLFRKEVRLRDIVVEHPVVMLARDRTGLLSIDDLLTGKPSGFTVDLDSIQVKDGVVRFTDRMIDPEGFTSALENMDLFASGLAAGEMAKFRFSGRIPGDREHATVSLAGTARIPGEQESLSAAKFDVTLSAKNLGPGRYWPYYGHYLPFEQVHGSLDLDGRFTGTPHEFSAKGLITINDLRLNYPQVFHAPLTPRKVRLAYELELSPRDLSIKSFDLSVDGLRAMGNCTIGDFHSDDPRITARATTSPFRLEEFRNYIPYGIIVKNVADIIERHIVGGIYRLDEGRLDGRVSQILHMERDDNYNTLSVRGHVEKGLVILSKDVPTFNNIAGELEMRGKDFLVTGITGNFGVSPFTLEGKIVDYPLATPASFPFTMAITPAKAEVAWLLRQDRTSDFAFSGQTALSLAGSGTVTDYQLTGSWDLSAADYRYRQLLHKPSGMVNRLELTAHLGKTEARLTDFHYEIPSIDVTATAAYRYNVRQSLTFAAATSRFQATPLLSVLPWLEKYHPSGTVEAHFAGSGNPAEADGIRFKGNIALEDFSARPLEQIKPVKNINGTIHLTEGTLATEQLTGTLGDSSFTVKGRVAGFADPAANLLFTFPELHLADFGFQSPGQIPEVRNLTGTISLKHNIVEILSMSGEVARTRFTVCGQVLDVEAPKISVRADFPYLRAEDLAPLTRLQRAGSKGKHPSDITLTARVTAAAGSIGDITFEKLDTELTLHNDLLSSHSLTVGVFGGTVSGSGEANFAADGGPAYRSHYFLDHVDAASLVQVTGIEQQLTGVLSGEGEVFFSGRSREDLKESVHGSAEIKLTEGAVTFPANKELRMPHKFPFKTAQARLSFARKKLDITSARIEAFGGVITGNGGADFGIQGGSVYRLTCSLVNVDAANFFRAFDVTRELSGHLNLQGEWTASGDSVTALKKSLSGKLTMHLKKGVIKKYGIISKVFSVLNVSQLLDYQLPDVRIEGMPYDRIDGTYHFNDGRVETREMSMHSPSLNMSVVGSVDIVNRTIDAKIGIQPVQTVGKVIHRIPVFGWLLTGGDKSFLVVYYEAKGNWDDPKITSISMKSLSSGILNILDRALDLPDEMINKPGKVFLGN